jgi:plasmid replication initiation protein
LHDAIKKNLVAASFAQSSKPLAIGPGRALNRGCFWQATSARGRQPFIALQQRYGGKTQRAVNVMRVAGSIERIPGENLPGLTHQA